MPFLQQKLLLAKLSRLNNILMIDFYFHSLNTTDLICQIKVMSALSLDEMGLLEMVLVQERQERRRAEYKWWV